MAFGYTNYRAAFRGARANNEPVGAPAEVGGPVGPDSTTVQDAAEMAELQAREQARALRNRGVKHYTDGYAPTAAAAGQEMASPEQITDRYGTGGFDGVKQTQGWYDMPAYARTQILAGLVG